MDLRVHAAFLAPNEMKSREKRKYDSVIFALNCWPLSYMQLQDSRLNARQEKLTLPAVVMPKEFLDASIAHKQES